MLSLISKNRNKKKRIRKSYVGALPQKIIFDALNSTLTAAPEPIPDASSSSSDSDSDSSDSSDSDSTSDTSSSSDSEDEPTSAPLLKPHQPEPEYRHPPRLIPPSERQESGSLPPGLFVTSVDVEEALSQSKRKNKKKKKTNQQQNATGYVAFEEPAVEEPWQDPETFYASPPVLGQTDALYSICEPAWESYPKLEDSKKEVIKTGSVVGWYVSNAFFSSFWCSEWCSEGGLPSKGLLTASLFLKFHTHPYSIVPNARPINIYPSKPPQPCTGHSRLNDRRRNSASYTTHTTPFRIGQCRERFYFWSHRR